MTEMVLTTRALLDAEIRGMHRAQRIVALERDRRAGQRNGLWKFICGALEDAEREIAADIVRHRAGIR